MAATSNGAAVHQLSCSSATDDDGECCLQVCQVSQRHATDTYYSHLGLRVAAAHTGEQSGSE